MYQPIHCMYFFRKFSHGYPDWTVQNNCSPTLIQIQTFHPWVAAMYVLQQGYCVLEFMFSGNHLDLGFLMMIWLHYFIALMDYAFQVSQL